MDCSLPSLCSGGEDCMPLVDDPGSYSSWDLGFLVASTMLDRFWVKDKTNCNAQPSK